MPILLASYKNKTAGFVLKENKKQVTIGRDPGNDMPLPMTRVSKVHAALSLKNNQWFIRDLGSSNGTKLNNKKLCARFFGSICGVSDDPVTRRTELTVLFGRHH